ncbi:MAG: ATP-binding cassette domain-containing protein [Longimicrobiales bacterium]
MSETGTRQSPQDSAGETNGRSGGRSEDAVRVKELTRKFGDFTAVDSVTFKVDRGQIFGFLGPNGAGKTTTIRMLIGLLPPTSGEGWVAGPQSGLQPHSSRAAESSMLLGQLSAISWR